MFTWSLWHTKPDNVVCILKHPIPYYQHVKSKICRNEFVTKPGIQSKSLSFGKVILRQNSWTMWSAGVDSIPARWTLSDAWLPCSVLCARLPVTATSLHNYFTIIYILVIIIIATAGVFKKGMALTMALVICHDILTVNCFQSTFNLSTFEINSILLLSILQCFDTVGWATGRASGL